MLNTLEVAFGLAAVQIVSSEELFASNICHQERSGLEFKKFNKDKELSKSILKASISNISPNRCEK